MTDNHKINYIELPASDLTQIRTFYGEAFDWSFTEYGENYLAIDNSKPPTAGLDGGFYKADLHSSSDNGSALVIIYSTDLEETMDRIKSLGGQIIKPIFDFPGGRRFHFSDPNGNELAVWSDL